MSTARGVPYRRLPLVFCRALVDWGEGNATWLYRYDGKRWLATSYASESN